MTDPKPLTDDELVAIKLDIDASNAVKRHDAASLANVARLVATVEQTRKERDDAHAVIRRFLDDWQREPVQDGDLTAYRWYRETGWDIDMEVYEPETPGEVDAIRMARAGTERTTDA